MLDSKASIWIRVFAGRWGNPAALASASDFAQPIWVCESWKGREQVGHRICGGRKGHLLDVSSLVWISGVDIWSGRRRIEGVFTQWRCRFGCGSRGGSEAYPLRKLSTWSIDCLTCSHFRTVFSKKSRAPGDADFFSVLLPFPFQLSPSRSQKSRSLFANNLTTPSTHMPRLRSAKEI